MRKVLVSLLVVAMLLGLVGTAFAYTDVTANKYVDQATAFGWLTGYPDGTFKPAGNITRAEAAAVIVRGLGLAAAADAAKGLASKFTDVPATHWASGYINVCTTKSILKGYPDGTFKPEANITNAEIVTMIVRALNRESQAVGEWPVGHITVAAAEGIIGTGFASNALATREGVATFVVKAADVPFLKLTSNGWEEDTKTMAEQNELTLVEDLTVTDYDADAEEPSITVTGVGAGTYSMATGYAIEGGKMLRDLPGSIVDLYVNDDDEVVFVAVSSTGTVKSGDIKSLGGDYFYLYNDSKQYKLATDNLGAITADVYRNGVEVTLADLAVDDVVTFTMEDNRVVTLRATVSNYSRYIVTSIRSTGDTESQYIKATNAANTKPKTFYMTAETKIELDGKTVAVSAIKEDMIIDVQVDPTEDASTDLVSDPNQVAIYVKATEKTVSGKITAKRTKVDGSGSYYYLSIDGVEYRLESNSREYDGTVNGQANVFALVEKGDSVTVYLSPRGRITLLDGVSGSASYGRIVSKATGGDYVTFVIDVKGQQVTYEVSEDDDEPTITGWDSNDYILISKNEDGRLDDGCRVIGETDGPDADALADVVLVSNITNAALYGAGSVITDVDADEVDVKGNAGTANFDFADNVIVYIDGKYAEVSELADDYRIMWVLDTDGDIVFAVADSFCDYEKTLIVSADNAISGADGAVEPLTKLFVYDSNEDATYDVWAAGFVARPAALATGTALADGDKDDVAGFDAIDLTGVAAVGDDVYVRIEDAQGNYSVVKITVK